MQTDHGQGPLLFYTPGACSLSCMVTLDWIGKPYRLSRVDRTVRSQPAFARINPRGQVPALQMDGRLLAENAAILAGLADRAPESRLIPVGPSAERDEVNQWLSYFGSGFHVAFYPFFLTDRYIQDPVLFPQIKAAALENIRKNLAYVDQRLEGQTWVHGGRRSVLDPYLYAMSRWTKSLVDVPKEYPNVARHQATLEADPSVQFALATEKGTAGDVSPSGALQGHLTFEALAA